MCNKLVPDAVFLPSISALLASSISRSVSARFLAMPSEVLLQCSDCLYIEVPFLFKENIFSGIYFVYLDKAKPDTVH